MQAQAMYLEIDLAGSCVFEHRPNSRPERCMYNYLYFYLWGFCILWQHSKFKYIFYRYKFQNTRTSVKTAQYNSWDSQDFPITLQTKTGCSRSLHGHQVRNQNLNI